MKLDNRLPEETQRIIDEYENDRAKTWQSFHYTQIDTGQINIPGIRLLYFMTCLYPQSCFYGTGCGVFAYRDGRVFKFHYNIHTPASKGPHRSNQMTDIQQIILTTWRDIPMTECVETGFGSKAFWYHTPMDSLDEESQSLRLLMKGIQACCRRDNLCRKLRKTDKVHEEWYKNTTKRSGICRTGGPDR